MNNSGLPRLVVLVVIIMITGLALYGYKAFRKDVTAMQSASLEDITWTSFQLEQEFSRFLNSLNGFQIDGTGIDSDDVNDRFDILWSRIAIFQQGRVGERLASYDRETQTVTRLFEHMKGVDRQIVGLTEGDDASASGLYSTFTGFATELRNFSRLVSQGEETRGRGIRDQLQSGVNRTLLLGLLAIVIALTSLAYINRESMKFKRLATTNRKLADAAEKASRAKSQFLTMMSHELRTPMNGVLGLLALAKQGAIQPNQISLIKRAEHSGQQMVGLLEDILDFSAMSSDDLQFESKPFMIADLALDVRDQFTPLANHEGISFTVSVSDDCPRSFKGDFRRLRQASNHLVQYIVETAGARDATMNYSFSKDRLIMTLSFGYASDGGGWTPDLILGDVDRDQESFASNALGPAIARGFIDAMQGSLTVNNTDGERIEVIVSVPIEKCEVAKLDVAVITVSDAMAAICRAALSVGDVNISSGFDGLTAQVVLIESGNTSENDYVSQAQKKYPGAVLGAIGAPITPGAFDFTVKFPMDFNVLHDIITCKAAKKN